jgi:hypothetical protein
MTKDFIHEMLLGLDSAIAVFDECEIVIPENHPDPDAISDCIGNVRTAHAIACKEYRLGQQAPEPVEESKPEIVCYCGSLRVAIDAFKKAEYEAVIKGEIALLPCCMFVDIQREYGAESDYKIKADEVHKRKIDICDKVMVLNVGGYIGESTRSEINYAISIGKPVEYLEP